MNLKIEKKGLRLRLTQNEWQRLQAEGRLVEDFFLGQEKVLKLQLKLAETSALKWEDFAMSVHIDPAAVKIPARKKDPYWLFTYAPDLEISLDVDIFTEEL